MDHVELLRNMFLMTNGEFYQVLHEESRLIMSLPPTSTAEHQLNNFILPQTISRLKMDDIENYKRFSLKLNYNGFDYPKFENIKSLNIVGNVVQCKNNYLRFQVMKNSKQSGSVWYSLK